MHQGGELFVYQPHLGYWRTFEGLPPPHLFEVVRQFFILLEGIYRNFKGHVKRNDKAVLQSMDMFIQDKSMPELLSCCESTCAWNKGNNLLKKREPKKSEKDKADADTKAPDCDTLQQPEDDDYHESTQPAAVFGADTVPASQSVLGDVPIGSQAEIVGNNPVGAAHTQAPGVGGEKPVQAWYIVVAQSISKFNPGLIKKLEHCRIIPFLSEWCVTQKKCSFWLCIP